MILVEALHENGEEMQWNQTWPFRLPVVVPKQRLHRRGCLDQMVMRNLREQMVHNVRADVVMDFVEDPVVAVDGGQPPAHVVPLLPTIPWNFLLVAMVMKVCDEVQPHDIDDVRYEIELKRPEETFMKDDVGQDRHHSEPASGWGDHFLPLARIKQVARRAVMGSILAWAPRPQVERIR